MKWPVVDEWRVGETEQTQSMMERRREKMSSKSDCDTTSRTHTRLMWRPVKLTILSVFLAVPEH